MLPLKQLDYLPDALLTATPQTLHQFFPHPTLIHLSGKDPHPLFVSILLHGNETTSFLAIQALLKKYRQQQLPRALTIFLGNTVAASKGLRRLDGQADFNRIWPGTELAACAETRLASEIFEIMKRRDLFASIDIHNNTGLNPHYACVNKQDDHYLQLARLFSRLVVYFLHPTGVQSMAFSTLCPAVTVECGHSGQQQGTDHALEYLNSCLHLTKLADHPVLPQDIDLFNTVAVVKISPKLKFSFEDRNATLLLDPEIERMNFTEIPIGTRFGIVNQSEDIPLLVFEEKGQCVTDKFFTLENNQLLIRRKMMPSMLTLDERVIKQDCLCYLMERIDL
ncbi:MAG: M14 family metallopeptidase [Methylococcales bacterium]|nr:M14 family metallopeptidase [Methylococcales bacterium]